MRFIINWLKKLHIIHSWSDYILVLQMPKHGLVCGMVKDQPMDAPLRLYEFTGSNKPHIVRNRICTNQKCLKVDSERVVVDMISIFTQPSDAAQEGQPNHIQTQQSLH